MKYCPFCQREVKGTKKFNWFIFLLLCVTGVGGIFYLLWYFAKPSNKCPICGGKTEKR
jgi:hypothetical protein